MKNKPIVRWPGGKNALWTAAEMEAFAGRVLILEGDWLVTVNDCPANRELFAAHETRAVVTRAQCANQKTCSGRSFGELVIRRKARHRDALKAHEAHRLPLAA